MSSWIHLAHLESRVGWSCKVRSARMGWGVGQSTGEGLQIYIYLFPVVNCGWFRLSGPRSSVNQRGVRLRVSRVPILTRHFDDMHPSSTSTTPFSVKDILNLEHQDSFVNEFLMAGQHASAHYQDRGHYDLQPEPMVPRMQEKLGVHIPAAEEEINEHGEKERGPTWPTRHIIIFKSCFTYKNKQMPFNKEPQYHRIGLKSLYPFYTFVIGIIIVPN